MGFGRPRARATKAATKETNSSRENRQKQRDDANKAAIISESVNGFARGLGGFLTTAAAGEEPLTTAAAGQEPARGGEEAAPETAGGEEEVAPEEAGGGGVAVATEDTAGGHVAQAEVEAAVGAEEAAANDNNQETSY